MSNKIGIETFVPKQTRSKQILDEGKWFELTDYASHADFIEAVEAYLSLGEGYGTVKPCFTECRIGFNTLNMMGHTKIDPAMWDLIALKDKSKMGRVTDYIVDHGLDKSDMSATIKKVITKLYG